MQSFLSFIGQLIDRPAVQLAFWGFVDVLAMALGNYCTNLVKTWYSKLTGSHETRDEIDSSESKT